MLIRVETEFGPAFQALLAFHLAEFARHTAAESMHALNLDGLRDPGMTLWTAWESEPRGEQGAPAASAALMGMGGLKRLDALHGEIKSMRTAPGFQRRGVAAAILGVIVEHARAQGLTRLSLETGSQPHYAPARAFYEAHGFTLCPPFADYWDDPSSLFMTRTL